MNDPLFSLEGKVIVLTGGLGRLGRAYAQCLLARGAKVALIDRRAAIEAAPAPASDAVLHLGADVLRRSDLEEALAAITARWGAPDGLINNAALDSPPNSPAEENGPFETYPEESFDTVMAVNVKGVVLCCQVFGGAMAQAGRGSIVNIGSIYGMVSPDQRIYTYRQESGPAFFKPVAYSTSKSALYNLTRYLATYWGDKGVRVNTLTLAGVFDNQNEQFLAGYLPKVPLGRMAQADDYFGALVYLLSPASKYVTGSNLTADGGWTAW